MARPLSEMRPVLSMDDAPVLGDGDQRALDVIRRQLDAEFPHWTGAPDQAPAVVGEWPVTSGRARRAATVTGTLLLTFAAGGAASALVMTLYSRSTVAPVPPPAASPPRIFAPPVALPPRAVSLPPPPARPGSAARPSSAVYPPSPPQTTSAPAVAPGESRAGPAEPLPARSPHTISASPSTSLPLAVEPAFDSDPPVTGERGRVTHDTPPMPTIAEPLDSIAAVAVPQAPPEGRPAVDQFQPLVARPEAP